MADYIYLLQTRLTPAQQAALQLVRDAARARSMTIFLVGGAVRDLTSGSPIRDLDLVVQGNPAKLRKELEKLGATVTGEHEPTQSIFLRFPGGVRLHLGATLSVTFPKPGKPVYKPANILDDLRRRDFTANAMAISLNDGSFGLLMDPLNGIADLENRELRLVSNYGFIEDPSRMIRAARFSARLGWQMEEKTRQRYETGKTEGYISALGSFERSYELEEIFHEEDPLRVLRRLEAEGWAKLLTPIWTARSANEAELDRLRDLVGQFEAMGIFPDPSSAYFPLLTAKLAPKDVATLKKSFARPGFAVQIAGLDAATKTFSTAFTSKSAAAPSDAWKMLYAAEPEPLLWLAHTTKSSPLRARFDSFFKDWAQARARIPYQLMQEMRITPELPGYADLLDKLFFAIMDGKLDTPEAARAFLEPFSPPAPPPPVSLRRRAVKRETKPVKSRAKKPAAPAAGAESSDAAVTVPTVAATAEPVAAKPAVSKPAAARPVPAKPAAVAPTPAKAAPKPAVKAASAKPAAKPAAVKAAAKVPASKPAAAKPAAKKFVAKQTPAKKAVATKPAAKKPASKPVAAKKVPTRKAPAKQLPAKKAVAKQVAVKAKPAAAKKLAAKKPSKPAPKPAAKKVPAKKPAAKKPAPPAAKRRR